MISNLGKYEIVAELGQGAMGIVYKARDPLIGRMVALKTITGGLAGKPDLLERFYQEARSAGTLQHPNIVTIFELGKEGDTPYIAMEFLEGESLEKIIARQEALALSKKIGFMSQICSALDYAHKHGVIHRDIKPGNIMLTKDGNVKVVDFGIARLVDTSRTQTGLMIGTPAYMSPQLLRGERADAQADIWALGVMLYELVAYQRPFVGDNPAALMWNIISHHPKPLREVAPGCPAELEEVVGRMLEKEAPLRLQTMEDVLLELDPLWKRLQKDRLGELVAKSQQLIQNEELQEAQGLLREALRLDSSNSEAKTLLDRVSLEIRRVANLARVTEQIEKAQSLFDAGRMEEAKVEADTAVRIDPKYEPARDLVVKIQRTIVRTRAMQEKLQNTKLRLAEGALAEAEKAAEEALALDPANSQAQGLRKQIGDESARRERRKRIAEGLQQARSLWSQLRHEEAVQLLSDLQREFANEQEIAEVLATVRHDQAEQNKQAQLGEARNLLAAQRYDEAAGMLDALGKVYPADAAVQHLKTLVQQEQQANAKWRRFETELSALRTRVSEQQWEEALKGSEQLLKEFPQEVELQELLKFVRGERQRTEQKRALEEKVKQVQTLVETGSFTQAVKAAEKALTETPGNVDLMILLKRAQTAQKEKEKQEFLEKRIREVKARINRDDLSDAIDLARQTLMTSGPDTDITQLLHAAEMEIAQREKKKEQDKQFEAAKTMIASGDFSGATRLIDQAMATQILDTADPRVQQTLHDIRETQERQRREKEQAAEREQQRQRAEEEERKKKQAAAAAEKKQEGKTGKKKGKGEESAAVGSGAAAIEPNVPAALAPGSSAPAGSGTPSRDYVYQPATVAPGAPSAPLETVPLEAASATMIASGMATPVAKPTVGRAASFEATMIEVQAPPAPPKKAKIAPVKAEAEPRESRAVESIAPPIWKQPIPLAVGGVVLVAVLGGGIYFATRSSAPVQPTGVSAPTTAENTTPTMSGGTASSSEKTPALPAEPKAVAPVLSTPNQQTQRQQQQAKQPSQPQAPISQPLTPQRPAAQPVNQAPVSLPAPTPAPQQQVAAQSAPPVVQSAAAPAPVVAATAIPAPPVVPQPTPAAPAAPVVQNAQLNVRIVGADHKNFDGPVNEGQMMSSAFLDQPLALESSSVPEAVSSQAAKGSTLTLLVFVDQTGKIYDGRAQGGNPTVAAAVLGAAKASWKFNIPHVKGKAVKTTAVLTVQF